MTRRLSLLICVLVLSVGCRGEPDAEAGPGQARPQQPAAQEPPGRTAERVGQAPGDAAAAASVAPTLQVTTIDGDAYDLADHRGRWVVVNFWATWCAPCLKEMPELSALTALREHVEVIGLAYEEIEPEAMRAFLQEHPVLYPIAIVDVYAPPADFETPRGLPMTYLIAPDGRIARQFLGPVTAHELETAIAAAGGPEVPAA